MNTKVKVMILDEGRSSLKFENWRMSESESGAFQLWIDEQYICALEIGNHDMIVVSTDHKVELRSDA